MNRRREPSAFRAAALAAALLSAAGAGCSRDRAEVAATPGADDSPLVILTTTHTPPYSYPDEKTGEIVGIEIDIARAAAAKLGRRLEIRKAKFPELLPLVSEGKADMAASGITITEGRRQAVDFSEPYATEGGMFLYRAEEPMPSMIRAETLRVGTIDASTYDFYLTSHDVDPIRYDSFENAKKDLEDGKLDAVFFDSCAVKIVAGESGGTLAASRLETRENFGFVVRKGNVALKAALDEVIVERQFK